MSTATADLETPTAPASVTDQSGESLPDTAPVPVAPTEPAPAVTTADLGADTADNPAVPPVPPPPADPDAPAADGDGSEPDPEPDAQQTMNLTANAVVDLDDDTGKVVLNVGTMQLGIDAQSAVVFGLTVIAAASTATSVAKVAAMHRRTGGLTDAQLRPIVTQLLGSGQPATQT